jgi:two-component system sensor histidine kinase HydH
MDTPDLKQERSTNFGLRAGTAFLVLILLGVVLGTYVVIQSDRTELIERFEAEKEVQLTNVARGVEAEFDDIHDDLELTARLAYNVYPEQQDAIVMSLLGAVRAYRAAALVDSAGHLKLISDPRWEEEISSASREAILEAGKRAIAEGTYVSPRIGDGEDSWFRAFSQVVPSGEGAFVMLVDTRTFMESLNVLSADPQTLVVVLGPQGQFAPTTSSTILEQFENDATPDELKALLIKMAATEHGSYRIPWRLAGWTGFERGDVVVAFRRVDALPGVHWSVATLTSLSAIRSHEAALTTRLFGFAAFVALLLAGFGLYLAVATRRTAVLKERLASASELAHLHQKADTVLQTMPLAVCVLGDGGLVSDANAAWGMRWSHLRRGGSLTVDPESVELDAKLRAAIEKGEESEYFVEDDTLFGHEGSFHVYLVPFEPSSADARALVVVEDISTTRKLEAQLLRAEKLATVGVLAAGIAHEIGTPLGVVRGRAEYILQKVEAESSNARGLNVIIEQIDRVSRIIQELLDFSRVDVARTEKVDLGMVTEKVRELLRVELANGDVEFETEIPAGFPLLAADIDRLEQVLVNMIVNARDAMEGAPAPHIVTVRAFVRDSNAIITIEDTGTGIAAEHLQRVFDPFFSTKKRGAGTGLGLAVVSQIIRNHRGKVDVFSEPGIGTRFELTWPLFIAKEHSNAP